MKSLLGELFDRNLKPKNDSQERFRSACELTGLIERHEKRLKELLGRKAWKRWKSISIAAVK